MRACHTRPVADDEAAQTSEQSEPEPPAEEETGFGEPQTHVPAEIRNVSFPGAARGYDRRAVDAYVRQVNRLIAELEVGRSPQAAVRHALERVGEQTKTLLQQARETAEEITAGAREEADEAIARARAEAEEIVASASVARTEAEEVVASARAEAADMLARARAEADEIGARANAEAEQTLARLHAEAAERTQRLEQELGVSRDQAKARMRELHAETESIWKERQKLLDEIHAMGARLLEVAGGAARVAPAEASEEATPEGEPRPEAESVQA
jgi:DivIVA domain-containing protein